MQRLSPVVVVFAVALGLIAAPALGFQCPLLIGQAKDAMAKLKAGDPKIEQAGALIAAAEKLHNGGQHAESVKKANEALELLGLKKTESRPPARRGYSY